MYNGHGQAGIAFEGGLSLYNAPPKVSETDDPRSEDPFIGRFGGCSCGLDLTRRPETQLQGTVTVLAAPKVQL